MEGLGADVCLNYKTEGFEAELWKATEGFVDVYFGEYPSLAYVKMMRR